MIKTISHISISDSGVDGTRYVSGNEQFVLGHYPHLAIFPGVLSLQLINSLIQKYCDKMNIRFCIDQIVKVQYLGIICPGDKLLVRVWKVKEQETSITFRGEIISNAETKVKAIIINRL